MIDWWMDWTIDWLTKSMIDWFRPEKGPTDQFSVPDAGAGKRIPLYEESTSSTLIDWLIDWSNDWLIDLDRKRGRQTYTRWQTLELEKEFHTNRNIQTQNWSIDWFFDCFICLKDGFIFDLYSFICTEIYCSFF